MLEYALPQQRIRRPLRLWSICNIILAALAFFCMSSCGSVDSGNPPGQMLDSDVDPDHPDRGGGNPNSGTSNKPSLSFTVAPVYCCNPRSMSLEAEVLNISNLHGIQFEWDFGDGRSGQGPSVEHTYGWPGRYVITLEAHFPDGSVMLAEQELLLPGEAAPGDDPSGEDPDVDGPMPPEDPVVDETPDGEEEEEDEPGETSGVNEEAIAQVLAGEVTTANASWWGFDPDDATNAIQSAIHSGARTVVIPNMGSDWIVRPLFLASNQEIVFEDGVVVAAKAGAFHGQHDCLFSGIHVANVKLLGTNAILRMRKADYTGSQYSVSEWRHVLSLQGVSNFEASGLSFQSSGGDGLFIGAGKDAQHPSSRNVVIQDCDFYNNHRQGISVLSAENLTIDSCTIRGTIGTAPQAAIDLEPDDPTDVLINVQITNCQAIGNAGSGFMANLVQMTTTRPISVTVSNLLVQGSRQTAMRVLVTKNGPPGGFIHFQDCMAEGTEYSGLGIKWNLSTAFEVRFVNCAWRRNARFLEDAPIHMEFMGSSQGDGPGGIRFVDCLVDDEQARDTLQVVDTQVVTGTPDVSGTIYVTNSMIDAPVPESGWPLPDLNVELVTSP